MQEDGSSLAFQFDYELSEGFLYNVQVNIPIPTYPFMAFKYNGGATQD